jgi:hypothetical protein
MAKKTARKSIFKTDAVLQAEMPGVIIDGAVSAVPTQTKLVRKQTYCLITPKRVIIRNYIHLPYDEAVKLAKQIAVDEKRFVTVHPEPQEK